MPKSHIASSAVEARRIGWTATRLASGPFKGRNIGPGIAPPVPDAPDWEGVVDDGDPLPWGWSHYVVTRPEIVDDSSTGNHVVTLPDWDDDDVDERAGGKPEITGQELANLKKALKDE